MDFRVVLVLILPLLLSLRVALGTHPYAKLLRTQRHKSMKGPVSALKYYEIVNMEVKNTGDVAYVDFKAFHEHFVIILRPIEQTIYRDIFPQDIQVSTISDNSSSEKTIMVKNLQYFQGFTVDTHHEVHGYIRKTGIFDGIIHFQNKTDALYIEPAYLYFNESEYINKAFVYKASDYLISELEETTGTIDDMPQFSSETNHSRSAPANSRSRRSMKGNLNGGKHCTLSIVVDHLFYSATAESDLTTAVEEIMLFLVESDKVFRSADLLHVNQPSNVGFNVIKITILETYIASHYWLNHDVTDSSDLLNRFSKIDFSYSCLGLLFTHRQFEKDYVGLAWMGYADRNVGGICGTKGRMGGGVMLSTNTLLISTLSPYGPQSHLQAVITTAHEIGHAFGAEHDKDSNESCSPGEPKGNYIMAESLTDELKPNTLLFSSCSTALMQYVVRARYGCFQNDIPYCGNGRIEQGEECDCGTMAQCSFIDPTCTPAEGLPPDSGCTIRRAQGKVCSPLVSLCCTDQGQVMSVNATKVCKVANECGSQVLCDGSTSECPIRERLQNGSMCEDKTGVCVNGICQHSVCEQYNLIPCACAHVSCEMCCFMSKGTCAPLHKIVGVKPVYLKSGQFCDDNFQYRCDRNHKCIGVNTQDFFNKFKTMVQRHTTAFALVVCLTVAIIFTVGYLISQTVKGRGRQQTRLTQQQVLFVQRVLMRR